MAKQFDPAAWLDRWLKVGGVQVGAVRRISIVADLDGNAAVQQSLLGQLDSRPGHRELVREAALQRWHT